MGKKRKDKKPKKTDKLAEQTVEYQSWEQTPTYPSDGLTPARLSGILKDAAAGNMFEFAQLAEDMEEKDPDLQGVLGTRKLAVSGLEYEIAPASDDKYDVKIAEHCSEVIKYIDDFNGIIYDMMDALGKGYSVQELIWESSEGQWWINRAEYIQPQKFTFLHDNIIQRKPRLITGMSSLDSQALAYGKFLCHQHRSKSGLPTRNGLHRTLAAFWLFKNFDIRSWTIYLDRFAVPLRLGKYKSGANDGDKATLRRAVFNLAVDSAAIMSDSTEIEFIKLEGAKEGAQLFEGFAGFIIECYNRLILGHASSTEKTPGSLGGDDSVVNIRQDILASDAIAVEQSITQQILAPIVMFHYGAEAAVPEFKLKYQSEEDLLQAADILGKLVDMGVKTIPVSYFHERFGIPVAKKGEKTLADMQPSTQPSGNQLDTFSARRPAATYSDESIDKITDKLADQTSFKDLLQRAEALLDECDSLEQYSDRLIELSAHLNPSEKAKLIESGLVMADAAGRAATRQSEDA